MKFCWTTLYVKDMDESLRFYQEVVGLPLNRRMKPTLEQEIAFLGSDGTQVELICRQDKKDVSLGQDISMGFETPSLDALIEQFRTIGLAVHSGPFQPNPGIRFLYVLDPNGLKIQFVEFKK
jgi:lactoylglutathione lyase